MEEDDDNIVDADFEVIKGPDPDEPARPVTTPQWKEDAWAIAIMCIGAAFWVGRKLIHHLPFFDSLRDWWRH
jgi:hypothetical protein